MDLLALWGKTGEGNRYHPLLCHLLDVAAVAQRLQAASPSSVFIPTKQMNFITDDTLA